MGYSTQHIDKAIALDKVKTGHYSVHSASTHELLEHLPLLEKIINANESDHGHIILNLEGGHFVDYELNYTK